MANTFHFASSFRLSGRTRVAETQRGKPQPNENEILADLNAKKSARNEEFLEIALQSTRSVRRGLRAVENGWIDLDWVGAEKASEFEQKGAKKTKRAGSQI
jgi:hypothetical protein